MEVLQDKSPSQVRILEIEDEIANLEAHVANLRKKIVNLKVEREHFILQETRKASSSKIHSDNWKSSNFSWCSEVKRIALGNFGHESLRQHQVEILNCVLSNVDAFVVMKTGGGKSLCYQLPAIMSAGISLVICPLLSLIRDQTMTMNKICINSALALAGTMDTTSQHQIYRKMDELESSGLRLLYVTPEKIHKSKLLLTHLQKLYTTGRFQRIIVDECHCASQWGHDFRPDYAKLGNLRKYFPTVPILALTATSNETVRKDVMRILGMTEGSDNEDVPFEGEEFLTTQIPDCSRRPCEIFVTDFNRPNLSFEVYRKPDDSEAGILLISQIIHDETSNFKQPVSGIVYCFSQSTNDRQRIAYRLI